MDFSANHLYQKVCKAICPLVNIQKTNWKITMFLMGNFTISMAIFNSYVKLPEGKPKYQRAKLAM
jgi:hypothetical protein